MFPSRPELMPFSFLPGEMGKRWMSTDDSSRCQSFRSCLPNDQAVVIQKVFVRGIFFFRIKIETEVATNEEQIFQN